MSEKAQEYIQRYKKADSNRANWKSTWQKVGDYIHPIRGDINSERSIGSSRHTLIYDDTAQNSSDILVAGLFSYLTSPYMPWKRLVPRNQALLNDEDVGLWLQDTEYRMDFMFSTSNFYNAMATLYQDLVNINHGLMFINEDEREKKLVFHNISPADCVIIENNNHKVDTFMRNIRLSARQANMQWGDKAGSDVKQAISDNYYEKMFTFLHTVKPRDKYYPSKKDPENMSFESCYISLKDKEIIEEGGYPEFPLVAPRWSTYTDDVYGSCPGIASLNDVRTLNKAVELMIKQGEAQLNPPLDLTSGYKDRIKTSPGGLNIRTRPTDEIKPIITVGRIEISREMIADMREQVKSRYFVNTFLMLSQLEQRMTAYEVGQRENEKMMMLGPAIGRITDECLGPLIDRVFGLMERGGYFLPMPTSLQGQVLDVEYLSPLARAQKATQAGSIDRLVAFMAPLIQLYPDVADNLEPDNATQFYADVFGVPKNVVRGKKSIEAMRKTREQLQQQQAQQQQALDVTQGLKNIGEADRAATGDNSILQQIMGS